MKRSRKETCGPPFRIREPGYLRTLSEASGIRKVAAPGSLPPVVWTACLKKPCSFHAGCYSRRFRRISNEPER